MKISPCRLVVKLKGIINIAIADDGKYESFIPYWKMVVTNGWQRVWIILYLSLTAHDFSSHADLYKLTPRYLMTETLNRGEPAMNTVHS